ncbi:MAG TPA: hypothetical protein PJ991_07195 [Kiritimatiellia bacterium]|nr:hypothetical protein [Kiritimatiellia bacterium]
MQASDITFSSVGVTSMTVSWTDGNGASRIVVARAGSAVDANPSDSTSYSANSTFGSGAEIGTGNFVVYNGSGSSVAVSGLSANTVYHFRVYEYNGSGGSEDYLTSTATGNPASRTTLATEPNTQATTVTFSSVGTTSMTVGWTSGNGANRLVIARQGSAPSGGPVDGTSYTADADFGGSGSVLGDGKVVYQGSGSSFTLTGLSPATRYYLQVYEYNGSGLSLNYNTDSATGNPGNRYTLSNEPADHATSFMATTASSSQINLTWTAASGPPSGYIVIQRTSADPTGAPSDGQGYSVSDTIGDGTVAAIVTPGSATSVNITGLSASTAYHFSIVPFNWDGANAQTYNYYTAATIPTANATTYAAEPTTQATDITFPTRSQSSIQVSWTDGNGANRVVVAREGSAVDANPVDGTGYSASAVFGSGDALGSGFVVYNGSGSSVTVTGLKTNTTYHFRVYEFNGSAGTANYNTNSATGNPASQATLDNPPGIGVGGGINVTTMVGSSPSAGSFVVTNIGGALLSYVVSDDVGWLSVSPLTATNKSNGQTESHTITYTVTGLSGGVSNATITVTGTGAGVNEPTNSPQTIAVALTLTNIPAPQSIAAEVSGPEFVRIRAAEAAGRTIMIVHRQTNAPLEPDQGTSYSVGNDIGGGSRVLFRFTGSSAVSNLEHVVQAGSTNFYAFYAVNNNHYSPVELIGATTAVYQANVVAETFAYTNLQTMVSKSGGFGWTNNWSVAPGTNDFNVTTQMFAQITGYPVGGGNSLTGRGSRILRDFTAITNGKIYASFQLRIDNGGSSQFSGLSFFNNDSEVKFIGEGFSQVNQLTVGGSSGYQLANNTDYTIIAMHDFGASQTRAVIYTNTSQSVPSVEPVSWHVSEAASPTRINRIRLASNIGSRWDEVRIATNYYELLNIDPPGPGIAVGPIEVNLSVMKGTSASGIFTVTNVGAATLFYTNYITYGAGSGWLTVAPANASIDGALSRINTGTVSAVSLSPGVYVATNRMDGNQTNSAANIVFTMTVTNLPDVVAATATNDGPEMMRLSWTTAGYNVLVVHRDGAAPSADPTDTTSYSVGTALGGGNVIFNGSGTTLEHIVPAGSTNYYRFYSVNNNHYAPGLQRIWTTSVYRVGEIVEQFAYTNTVPVNGLGGGQGWTNNWSASAPHAPVDIVITASDFPTFQPDWPPERGNRLVIKTTNTSLYTASRGIETVTTGKVYVAALYRRQFNEGAADGKFSGIYFMDGASEVGFIGQRAPGNDQFGANSPGGGTIYGAADSFPSETSYLIIGRFDFSNKRLDAIYYLSGDTVPSIEPTTYFAGSTNNAADRITGIRLASGATSGWNGEVHFDEVRVAQSWYELLGIAPPDEPAIDVSPATIDLFVMKGSTTSSTFTVNNLGGLPLNYTNYLVYGPGASGWLTVAPANATVASAASRINTGSVNVAGIAVGAYTATNRVDGNQTNAAQFVSFNLTITNIPPVTSALATADGAEMVRLSWNSPREVMVVYREGSAPSADPVDNSSYGIGASIGGGTVTYKGTAQELEHVGLANGATHYYRIYAVNNNHYSAGEQVSATTATYQPSEIIEPFSYTNLVSLASLNGGQGWSGGWTIGSGTWAVRPSTASNNMVDIPNYPAETGNKIRLANPGDGNSGTAIREFPMITNGVVYLAGMMSYEFRGTNKYAGLSFMSNGVERAFFGKLYAPQQLFGLNSHGNPAVESAFEIMPFAGSMGDTNNVYLMVARYNFATRVMDVKAFHRTTEVPIIEPSSWDATDTLPANRMNGFNGVRLSAGSGTGAGIIGRVDFDEVRVATSWANLMKATGSPYATNYTIGNVTNYVSDGQMNAGTFPVVMALRSHVGVETTNTTGSFFIPNFDLFNPAGVEIVTNQNFASFSYQDGGQTVIASNNTHATVASSAITLGVYTSRWSAISSNGLSSIDVATLSNGTAITFTVFDDDVSAPEIATISSTNNSSPRNLHISLGASQISTGSGTGTNFTYTTTDAALAGVASTNPLIFWLGAFDSGSGLQRGNNTASTNSSLTIGSAIISNVFHWDSTRSSSFGRTFTNSATNAWSWIAPFEPAELENLVTNAAFGLGTNRITATWWDADNDRNNDQLALVNQQHGWLVVNDDDIVAPNIQNFNIRSFPTSLGNYTVTVAQLLSGSGWGITGRVSDTGSGINVNGTSTTQPNISPYYELWDHNGVLRQRQVFDNITFANGGATTLTSINGFTNSPLSVASPGVWTARVVVADADNDRPNDRIIATNEFPFTVILGDSQAGMGVSVSSLNVTSTFGVVAGGGTWPNFVVTNFGIGTLVYDVSISYGSGFGWLSVTPSNSISVNNASSRTHTVSVNTGSLNPGTYTAVIALSGNQTNGTRFITNHLTVIGYNVGEIVDQFTNAVSGNLNGANGGTGWTNSWSTDPSGAFTFTAGNLTVPANYPAASGGKVCGDSSSELRAFRSFPVFNTGKVFMAVSAQQSSGMSAGYYGISFMSNSTEVAYAGKLFGNGNFGLDLAGNGGQQSAGFGVTGIDPYFFVGMYDFDSNTFYGRAYFGGTLPLTEPTWTASLSPTTPIGSINGVRLGALNQGTVCFDEVRVARSWENLLNQFTSEPTLHSVNMTFTNVMTNAMTVNWNIGNGLARIVVARQGSPVSFTPVDGVSYTANNDFSLSTDLGSGNKIIYNGSGNSVPVIGLDIATRYYYAVFEYNGSGATSDYLTNGTFLTGNRWTLSTEPVEAVTGFNAYTVSDTEMSNTWTQAGGSPAPSGYLIARRNGAAVTFVPQDGVGYTNGQVVPNARVFVVTPGSAEYFLHENLTPCATYHFAIYPFRWNGSAADTYNYYTNTPATASEVTTCAEPGLQASNIVFSAIGTNRITLTWERGDGERSMVVVRGTNAVNQNPVDGQTYTANTTFGSGSHLGNGNFVVFRGTGNTVTVTGLAPGVTYHFRIYEFNGSGGGSDYITTTANNNPRSTATASFGIVEDKFDYPTDWDNLFGKSGGTGWTNSWGTLDGLVEVGGFNMPAFGGYPSDSGTRAGFMNSVTRRSAHRNFPGRTSGQLFLAIKINVGDTATSGYFGVNLLNGSASSVTATGFVGKAFGVANNRLSLEHNGTVRTNRISGSNSGYTLNSGPGNDYLMVMMYDFDTKEFRARAYTPGQVAHADPTKENAWDVQMNNVYIDRVDGIEIVGSGLGNCAFDHIRIGPSWEEVMWNLPDGWHEDQGPIPTLVYIGTNYNSAFHSQVITNLSDAELRSASLIDFAVRWDTPNGMFLTNNTATNRNIGSPNARVTPNWDPLAIGAATNQFGLDRYFTNFFGFNNSSVVTTFQYSAFNITNIDFEIQYFVTVSAESAPAGSGTINAPNGSSWAAIPTNRAITINYPLRFYVYDDDPDPPMRGEGGMVVMRNQETLSFQNLDDSRRRFFITDDDLANYGMDVVVKAYDEYSRLQRAESGDPSTNINITIPGLVESNTSYFVYDRSTPTANTTNLLTSNLWSFSSSMFTYSTISDLWGGDGTSLQGQDLPVRAMVPDNDEDRVNDQAFLEDELFGFIRIIDNDTEPPVIGNDGLKIIAGNAVISSAVATNLLAGWNFNDTANRKTVNHGSGTMTDNLYTTNNNTGSSINLVGADVAGQDITIQGATNVGRYIQFQVSMRYYQNLVMSFAAQRSGTGYDSNTISYSINGGAFVNFETGWNPNTSFALKTVNFSSVSAMNDAESVVIRITLGGGTGGNNRYDNMQFNASPIRYYEITDNQLANVTAGNPLLFSFNVYDTISGLARDVSGASNMHVSIGGMATNNTANFAASRSSANTTVATATSLWSFTSFTYNQIGELYANGTSNRPVFASVSDADFNRQNDNLWISNAFFGLYRVIDQDTNAPVLADINLSGANPRPFLIATNGTAPVAGSTIRGSQLRRSGTGTNTQFQVSDADLANAGSIGLQFVFGARDVHSGVSRGTSGSTNDVMSFSVGNTIVGNYSDYSSALSTPLTATNQLLTNFWVFGNDSFDGATINNLIDAGWQDVRVTIPDTDDDRPNDRMVQYNVRVGQLRVIDDDIRGPAMTSVTTEGIPGSETLLLTSFETSEGWPGFQGSGNRWTNIVTSGLATGTWYGTGYINLNEQFSGDRKAGFTVDGVGEYFEIPPRDNIGKLTVLARLSGGETNRHLAVEYRSGSDWISLGSNEIVSTTYELLTWNVGITGVSTLRIVRVGENGTPGIYMDNLTLTEDTDWVSTNQVSLAWTEAVDDFSGIDEYRVVVPGVNAVIPTGKTDGQHVGANVTSSTFTIMGHQGVLTGFVFAIDNDNDRPNDRAMGNVVPVLIRVDTNPPPRAVGLRASDAANDFLFDPSIDETSEIKVEWTPPGATEAQAAGWRQSDNAPLSPWDSYIITYYEVGDDNGIPVANSITQTITRASASWSNVLNNFAFTNLVLSNLNFDAYYMISIQGRDQAGNVGLATNVIGNTDRFVVTQGVNRVALDLEVFWKGVDGRDYDVLYIDAPNGFNTATSNQWAFMQYTNRPVMFDTGGVARLRPGEMTNTTYRFYRVARTDRWQTNLVNRSGSVEIYVTKALNLFPGENWHSLFFVPDTATVSYIFNTNLLPAADNFADSTKISWFGPSAGGTTNQQGIATAVVWLAESGNWVWHIGGAGNANEKIVPLDEGFLLELPPSADPQSLVLIGQLPTNEVIQVIPGGSVATNTIRMLSHHLPVRTPLSQMGFIGSGLIGHNNGVFADEIRILAAGGSGSMQAPKARIRLRSDQTTWQYSSVQPGMPGNPANYIIEPDDAVIIVRRNAGSMFWTNRVNFALPTKNFSP